MAGQYFGVSGVARKVKNQYIGVGGVARKVKNGFIGVASVARKFFSTAETCYIYNGDAYDGTSASLYPSPLVTSYEYHEGVDAVNGNNTTNAAKTYFYIGLGASTNSSMAATVYGAYKFTPAVDLTDYKSIIVNFSSTAVYTFLGVATGDIGSYNSNCAVKATVGKSGGTSLTIDVSALSGSYYIYVGVYSSSSSSVGRFSIKNIQLVAS